MNADEPITNNESPRSVAVVDKASIVAQIVNPLQTQITTNAEHSIARGRGGTPVPVSPWKPGISGNPAGRANAGAMVLDFWHQMNGWPLADVEAVMTDPTAPMAKIQAARCVLDAASRDKTKSGSPIAGPELDRILDRTIGKAQQNINIVQQMDPLAVEYQGMAIEALERMAAALNSCPSHASERPLPDATSETQALEPPKDGE